MPTPDLFQALQIASCAVSEATQYAVSNRPTHVISKGDRDVVTNIDVDVERLIRDVLSDWDPSIGFVGEEHGASGDRDTYWVLDPIDGTVNLTHGSPLCAIALALVHDYQPVLGITAAPFLDLWYWAVAGDGACRNGEPITVSSTSRLSEALIGLCDYGSGPGAATRDRLCRDLDERLTAQAQGVRRWGSTALDLVWVADGTLDASILIGNRTWDTAAGVIIAREAGALVVDADGSQHSTQARCTLATTPTLAQTLLPMMDIARDTPYWPPPTGAP